VWDFYRTYYTPSNAILCITGHFQKEKVIQLVKKYFNGGSESQMVEMPTLTFLQPENEIIEHEEASVPSPGIFLGYRLVDIFPSDHYALKFIEFIMLRGENSRLFKRLITRERIASRTEGGLEERGDQGVFKIFVATNSEQIRERCQRLLFSEITRLGTSLTTEEEYLRAKNMIKMNMYNRYGPVSNRALFLVETLLAKGNLERIDYDITRSLDVTRSDIMGITARYLMQKRIQLDVRVK
jgi:predicted Zn-dependent peptidase